MELPHKARLKFNKLFFNHYLIKPFHPIHILRVFTRKLGFSTISRLLSIYYGFGSLSKAEKNEIKKFDYVHFHNISMFNEYGRIIQKLGIKTILTTHTPEPMVDEILSGTKNGINFLKKHKKIRRFFIKKELNCLKKSNYLMYPVPQVAELYTDKDSSILGNYIMNHQNKIFYVPTGILDIKIDDESKCYLENRNIPQNSIKICYVGRHNEVKGYPYLKSIAEKILKQRNDVYFIVGGEILNEKPLDHPNWIELGWVDTKQLLKEINLFILPNKKTYFDIIALEILRSGVPLVTTLTGGNKYLSTLNTGGIVFIPEDNPDEASNEIINFLNSNFKELGHLNRKLYEDNFSLQSYIQKYVEKIESL